jgi:acetyl-CoA acyltransferase
MKQIQDAYIVAATRTPIGRSHRGFFRNTRPDDLLATALRSALAQVPNLDPAPSRTSSAAAPFPKAQQGLNVARIGAVLAGLPKSVGGITVNRFCASGLSAVQMAADRIRVGEADVMIAAGTESMSMVPMMGNSPSLSPTIFSNPDDIESYGIAYGMGLTAEKVAQQWKVGRDAQDAFAYQSHMKAIAAMKAGEFAGEITPVEVAERSVDLESAEVSVKTRTVNLDEGARPDTTVEGLAKLKTVFAARGSVTAGNSSQTSDGAGALILVSEAAVKRFGLQPLARFVSYASRGVPPHIMGIGPIEAIPAALKAAGLKQDAIDWIELNEAFAAQSLAVINTLGLDPAKVNPMGGAIALGHPAGRHRRYPVRDSRARAAPQESEVRHGDHVRRHGPGRRRHLRARLRRRAPPYPVHRSCSRTSIRRSHGGESAHPSR